MVGQETPLVASPRIEREELKDLMKAREPDTEVWESFWHHALIETPIKQLKVPNQTFERFTFDQADVACTAAVGECTSEKGGCIVSGWV